MNRLHFSGPRWWLALAILVTMMACSFLQKPVTEVTPSSTPEESSQPALATEANESQAISDEPIPNEPDPLDYLLDLRSIRFNLTTSYPDQTSNSREVEIDAAGNMHLKFSIPHLTDPAEDFEAPAQSFDFEVYVVDEMDYQFDRQENNWFAASQPTDYRAKLSEELHGMDGPGLWLDLLPAGSLQSAGQETVGGFTTQKVNVKGTVDDQTITGTLWFDVESRALVQVELHVPAALLSMSEEPAQGEVLITLEAQKAEIPDLTVP